jgi:hypothetical protein
MHKKQISDGIFPPPEPFSAPGHSPGDPQTALPGPLDATAAYLTALENPNDDIRKLDTILQRSHIILEIGCGDGKLAWEIARNNPDIGVIATDRYDLTIPTRHGSYYQKTALVWKDRHLESQHDSPENLVLLRADITLLSHLPQACIDTILLVNPEPKVGRTIMETLVNPAVFGKIRPGEKQIVILPFSREMGVSCCGGNEFYHDKDWSRGLGFMMASGFDFRKGEPVQWHVDLARFSSYSRNSTQKDVYVFGCRPQCENAAAKSIAIMSCLKAFVRRKRQVFSDA